MKRIVSPGTDECIFCGGSPTNNEHVFSAWSHRHLQKGPGKWLGAVGTRTLAYKEDLSEIKGRGHIYDWQVKCICETCNNGWMRELENKAIPVLTPLIKGERHSLTKNDQRIAAGWACLKAIIGEYESPHFASWSQKDHARLKKLRLPPSNDCVIVIGRFKRDRLPMHWLNLPMNFLWGKENWGRLGEPTTEFNSAATTQVIGELLIHVIHAPKLRRILKRFNFPPQISRKLRLVWPAGNAFDWPPDTLSDAEAHLVANGLYGQINRAARRILACRQSGAG